MMTIPNAVLQKYLTNNDHRYFLAAIVRSALFMFLQLRIGFRRVLFEILSDGLREFLGRPKPTEKIHMSDAGLKSKDPQERKDQSDNYGSIPRGTEQRAKDNNNDAQG